MKINRIAPAVYGLLTLATGVGLASALPASAQEHRPHGFYEPYRAGHWVFDGRHNHGHYYPSIGYGVTALPPGYLTVMHANRHFFFQAGVWYTADPGGFVVVRPPLGIIVPMLPPDYSTVMVGRVPYYYANDVYYVATPTGYAVTEAPQPGTYTEAPIAPAVPGPVAPNAPGVAPAAPGNIWYYCESAKAYYPYVPSCQEGWKQVPATPPAGR